MGNNKYSYSVYRKEQSIKILSSKTEAFDYLKKNALRHKRANFRIEKIETLFDSSRYPKDKNKLNKFRGKKTDKVTQIMQTADSDDE
jgi:hypothetical protein